MNEAVTISSIPAESRAIASERKAILLQVFLIVVFICGFVAIEDYLISDDLRKFFLGVFLLWFIVGVRGIIAGLIRLFKGRLGASWVYWFGFIFSTVTIVITVFMLYRFFTSAVGIF